MIKVIGCALIQNAEGKFLAERLNKERVGGVIVPPGGKLEDNESVRNCVIREVKEELNIDIEITGLAAITEENYGEKDGDWIFIWYGARIISGTPTIMEPGKILELKWIDKTEFKNAQDIKWLDKL